MSKSDTHILTWTLQQKWPANKSENSYRTNLIFKVLAKACWWILLSSLIKAIFVYNKLKSKLDKWRLVWFLFCNYNQYLWGSWVLAVQFRFRSISVQACLHLAKQVQHVVWCTCPNYMLFWFGRDYQKISNFEIKAKRFHYHFESNSS